MDRKKEKKAGKDKAEKKAKKEKKDKKDKKSKKEKKHRDQPSEDSAEKPPAKDGQANDAAMEEALFGDSEKEEEKQKAPLPVKVAPRDDTENLMDEVEMEVARDKQTTNGTKAEEKKNKKEKKLKKDKAKKDKKDKKEKKRKTSAFLDAPSNIVEHNEPENATPPDKEVVEEDDIFGRFGLDDASDHEQASEVAPSSVGGNLTMGSVGSPRASAGLSPARSSRRLGRSLSPSPAAGSLGLGRRRRSSPARVEEQEKEESLVEQLTHALESIKPRRGLVIKDEEAHVFVEAFVKKMEGIAAEDLEEHHQGRPMLKKLRMLPVAVEVMEKFQFSDAFIAYGGCKVLALWLQDLPNGQLPSVHLRSTLLTCMERLPITKDALRDAGEPRLGQVVAKLQNHPEETPLNRRRAQGLVQRWLRQIMIPDEADSLEGFLAESDRVGTIPRPPPETEESLALQEEESAKRLHPAIPVIQGKEYVIQPISTAQPIVREKLGTDTYRGKLNEVLKVMSRPNKRAWKPYSVSVAGRQLNAD